MFCKGCGNNLKEGAMFCTSCGKEVKIKQDDTVVQSDSSPEVSPAPKPPEDTEVNQEHQSLDNQQPQQYQHLAQQTLNVNNSRTVQKKNMILYALVGVVFFLVGGFLFQQVHTLGLDFIPKVDLLSSEFSPFILHTVATVCFTISLGLFISVFTLTRNKLSLYISMIPLTFVIICLLTIFIDDIPDNISDVPDTTPPVITSVNQSTLLNEAFALINEQRESYGFNPLVRRIDLDEGADIRAKEISIDLSNSRLDGREWDTAYKDLNIYYNSIQEQRASGHFTSESLVRSQMNHNENREGILNDNFEYIGLGLYIDNAGTYYWVIVFMQP